MSAFPLPLGTEGHACAGDQAIVLKSTFHSSTCGAFLVKLFTIIDQTCTILLALAKQSLTCFDIRAENMLATSRGAIDAKIILITTDRLLSTSKSGSLHMQQINIS